jgi:hypothetical protein
VGLVFKQTDPFGKEMALNRPGFVGGSRS